MEYKDCILLTKILNKNLYKNNVLLQDAQHMLYTLPYNINSYLFRYFTELLSNCTTKIILKINHF